MASSLLRVMLVYNGASMSDTHLTACADGATSFHDDGRLLPACLISKWLA